MLTFFLFLFSFILLILLLHAGSAGLHGGDGKGLGPIIVNRKLCG
jgi:glycine cleavage system protein P-like pyridoxal-binding family